MRLVRRILALVFLAFAATMSAGAAHAQTAPSPNADSICAPSRGCVAYSDRCNTCNCSDRACTYVFCESPRRPLRCVSWTDPLIPLRNCMNALQGRVAWNYTGATNWDRPNLIRLCQGAYYQTGPADCFERVMHGGLDWGGGVEWDWRHAIDLCEGSRGRGSTVGCFRVALARTGDWREAIRRCEER